MPTQIRKGERIRAVSAFRVRRREWPSGARCVDGVRANERASGGLGAEHFDALPALFEQTKTR